MVTQRAYAKINIGLHILRKREDGYHDIETVFHRIDLFDELSFELSPDISMTCNIPDLPTDERNLCIKAVQLLQTQCGIRNGVHITLKKKIPVGAGLGGGSSDAAATLLGLAQLWNVRISRDELSALALQLGADVPYFLKAGTAYATGRGEILQYFKLDVPFWIVVVYPNISVSTSWAYNNLKIQSKKFNPKNSLKDTLNEHINESHLLRNLVQNDFEPLVLKTHANVARVKKELYDFGAEFAQLSGSGSAVFGFFSSESTANNAAKQINKDNLVFVTSPHFQAE